MKNRIVSQFAIMAAAVALIAGAAVAQAQDRGSQSQGLDQPATSQRAGQHPRQERDRTAPQSRPDATIRSLDRARPEERTGPETANRNAARNSDRNAQRNSVGSDHGRSETARRHEKVPNRRVASADQRSDIERYRHEHPRAAARCHDGFFTTTRNRTLACSKHGGIEIWLLQ